MDVTVVKAQVNMAALVEALRSALGAELVSGVSTGKGRVRVHLADHATAEQQAQAESIVMNHDPLILTAEQRAREQERLDVAQLAADQAANKLAQIDAILSEIDSDLGVIGRTPTNAQVVAVMSRLLARERAVAVLLRQFIRAFAPIAQRR